MLTDSDRDFLLKLADLISLHKAKFVISETASEGIYIYLDDREVFFGWLERKNAPDQLRRAAKGE